MTAVAHLPGRASRHVVASSLFLAASVLTAAWLALNHVFPALQPTGVPSTIVRLVIHAAILGGLWLGLARTEFDPKTRVTMWLAIAVPFTVWLAVIWSLAVQGAFIPQPGVPAIPAAIFLPLLIFLPFLLRSRRVGALLDAIPASWLVALQVYRVFGGIFLVGWAHGNLSGTFAIPAGMGDVLVGLLALPVAWYLHVDARRARLLGVTWNVLGLVDFTIAIGMGMLTAPGPLQLLPPERPNTLLGTFPTVMVPVFAVPSSILLHALSLRQLARLARQER